jgi:hypothetical protein
VRVAHEGRAHAGSLGRCEFTRKVGVGPRPPAPGGEANARALQRGPGPTSTYASDP